MRKTNRKMFAALGIIFMTIIFSNIIYAGNSKSASVYIDKISAPHKNGIVTNGDEVNITLKSQIGIKYIRGKIFIDDKAITNAKMRYVKKDDVYNVFFEIPEEIKIGDKGEYVYNADNAKIKFALSVESDEGWKDLESDAKDSVTYYKKLEDMQITVEENTNKESLRGGDSYSVNIKTTHPVDIESINLKGMENEFDCKLEQGDSKMDWNAEFTLLKGKEDIDYEDDIVNIVYEILLKDEIGKCTKIYNSKINYLRPVKIIPLGTTVNGKTNNGFVKNEDIISVRFKVSRPVEDVKAVGKIKFDKVKKDEEAENEYIAEYKVKGSEKHDENIVLDVKVIENESNIQEINLVNDIKYLKPLDKTSITSLKYDKTAVKDGDRLTVTFKTDRPVDAKDIKIRFDTNKGEKSIDSFNVSPSEDRCEWKCEFMIKGEWFSSDATRLKFKLRITDDAGNSFGKSYICSVFFKSIKIMDLKIISNNEDKHYVKDGNAITVSFKTTHPVNAKCNIAGRTKNIRHPKKDGNYYIYTYKFKLNNGEISDNTDISARLEISDNAESIVKIIEKSVNIRYYAPIKESCKSLSCYSSNDNVKYAIDNDIVTLEYKSRHPVTVKDMSIAGKEVKCISSNNGKNWQGKIKIEDADSLDLIENSQIKYEFKVSDRAGNTVASYSDDKDENPVVIYYAPIKISNLKMITDNGNKNLAKAGDILTISFTTTHKVNINKLQVGLSEFKDAQIIDAGTEQEEIYLYKATYKVPEDTKFDDKRIGLLISAGDAAGNETINVSENDTSDKIVYYRPIGDSISDIAFGSGNNNTTVKNGDTLTLSFKSSHPVIVSGKIGGIKVEFKSNDGGYSWAGSVILPDNKFSDNSDISYDIEISDIAGNKYSPDKEKAAKLKYFAPIKVNDLSMESDNESGNVFIAKNGDNITVKFSTTHPVYISDSTIAGQKADFVSDSQNMNWTAVYRVNDSDTGNMSSILMKIILNDSAGNTAKTVTHNEIQNVIYYAPIQVTGLKISSDNQKDGNLYAKDGNTVAVEFNTNHNTDISSGTIAGHPADVSYEKVSDTDYRWRMAYTIKNGDMTDMTDVGFSFLLDDAAHNNSVSVDKNSAMLQNSITYCAPITANTDFSSNYKDGTYVKNGDTITVHCKSSHPANVMNASIAGRQAAVQGNGTDTLSMVYTIPENEGAMPEGGIPFEYTIEDGAGNELKVNQVSESSVVKSITYDRTLPVVKISSDNTNGASFYSDTVKYSLEYTGTNIYEDGMSCIINGVESIGNFKRQPVEDGYKIDIELDAEENYVIKASCIDLAGNKDSGDSSISVTVDKTNPRLNIVNINTGHIFNSEFTLADFLNIEEKNLKDIDCMLTDSEGTHDWDINDAVKGDGKKTVTLKMTDMAGNTSDTYVYDFYVDVTSPSPVIIDSASGYLFKQGKNTKRFAKNMSINISLDKINVGEEPDKFTSIKVLDEHGNEYMDVIKSCKPEENGSYSISIDKDGKYTLCAQAVDSVGNETGLCEYSFTIGEKPWYKNTVVVTVAVCIVLVSIAGAGFYVKRKGK